MFPLPLSDFEYYMLVDDRPSHPMVFVMAAHLEGAFQQTALTQALHELVECHPFLNCRVANVPGRGWCWVPMADTSSPVSAGSTTHLEWLDGDEDAVAGFVPQVRALDLTSETGLQVVVRASPTMARLFLYIHHVCCDGIGGIQLLGELLARYGQKTAAPGERQPVFDDPRTELLLERENYDVGDATVQRHRKSLRKTAGKISRLLLRKPVLLAPSAVAVPSSNAETAASPAILEAVMSKTLHRSLRAAATGYGVSLNDFLIGQFLRHIRRWNSTRTPGRDRSWIRLSVPVSMRTRMHEQMPVANVVSYAFVTRRQQECDDMQALLQSIHRQTSDVVFNREGIVCLKIFKALRKFPRGMKMFLGLKSCLSTAVLANIGDIRRRFSGRFPLSNGRWVAGNVLVKHLTGVAPVRPNTRAAVSIGEYAGDLSISLRTDATVINATDSHLFLREFLAGLEQVAAETDGADRCAEPETFEEIQ
jgi:NRPS condensation-like uncharacterized protein